MRGQGLRSDRLHGAARRAALGPVHAVRRRFGSRSRRERPGGASSRPVRPRTASASSSVPASAASRRSRRSTGCLLERGPSKMSPFTVPLLMVNGAAGSVAMRFGLHGPNYASVSACATGAHSIGEAANMIRVGIADAMIAGGSEAPITPLAFGAFACMGALSRRNDDPQRGVASVRRGPRRVRDRRRCGRRSCSRSGKPPSRAAPRSSPRSSATPRRATRST